MKKNLMIEVIRKNTINGLCLGLGTALGMVINKNWDKINDKAKSIAKHEGREKADTLEDLFKDA